MQAFLESERRFLLRVKAEAVFMLVFGAVLCGAIVVWDPSSWLLWSFGIFFVLYSAAHAWVYRVSPPCFSLEAETKRMEKARSRLNAFSGRADYEWLSAEIELRQESIASLAHFMAERERERALNR
ncbi:hypothetical protein PO883_25145 [Massilia sp. DJPM01]|uniref:hypothetical protein n=1 Tax=Massilia sp. DJPM01 TaxID=3024404 RepID=UPI00259EF7F6|nr:hypothetical protein [Massilia sp. DJPM01]MDM5180474.1 hypothetical protein [Massilia sp. DJPM01]